MRSAPRSGAGRHEPQHSRAQPADRPGRDLQHHHVARVHPALGVDRPWGSPSAATACSTVVRIARCSRSARRGGVAYIVSSKKGPSSGSACRNRQRLKRPLVSTPSMANSRPGMKPSMTIWCPPCGRRAPDPDRRVLPGRELVVLRRRPLAGAGNQQARPRRPLLRRDDICDAPSPGAGHPDEPCERAVAALGLWPRTEFHDGWTRVTWSSWRLRRVRSVALLPSLRFRARRVSPSRRATLLKCCCGTPWARMCALGDRPQAAAVMMIPIPRRGRLRGSKGRPRLARDPRRRRAAHRQTAGALRSRYLGFIFARAAAASAATHAVREAHACLSFVVETMRTAARVREGFFRPCWHVTQGAAPPQHRRRIPHESRPAAGRLCQGISRYH